MTRMPGRALTVIDRVAAAVLLAITVTDAVWRARRPSPAQRAGTDGRGLLVLDAAYSLDAVRRRGIEHSLVSRDLDGFFSRVWHVHPLVGADADETADVTTGGPLEASLQGGHTVVEGHPALTAGPALPLLSFVRAQRALLRRLHELVSSAGIDVIRVGDPYYLGLLGLALARAHRLPLVIRINGNYDQIYEAVGRLAYPRLFRRRWVEKSVDRFVLRRADLVAGANRDNLQFALRNGTPANRGTVFPYGALIDPVHRTSPSDRSPVLVAAGVTDRPVLLAVTRLEDVKQVFDLVRVLATVRHRHAMATLVLIGKGAAGPRLRKLAVEHDVSEALVLAGTRDQAWIASALAEADVVLAASAGRALVEAALSATPVVAYDVDWHAELIQDGVTGRLVPFKDLDAMAAAVGDLLASPADAARLGAAARRAAAEVMDPDALKAHERAAYETLLAPRPGTGVGGAA